MNKQIFTDVREQAQKIAKAKGLQLILGKAQILFADPSLDITEEVLKELNSAFKPATPAAPAAPVAPAAPAPAAGDKPAAK